MPYELRTFGGLTLLGPDGEPIDAVSSPSKGAALLAFLAARRRGESATREELLPLLWPDRPDRQGRNALRVTLSRLRRVLPDGTLRGRGEEQLWIDESRLTSDVRAFRDAIDAGRPGEALGVYRGDFLAHFHLSDAAPFNRWADEQQGIYRRKAYEAGLAVAEAARAEGDLSGAESGYRRALSLAPLKEEAAASLMRILAEQEKRADALQLYRRFSDRLKEELDLSPSEEIEELAERVRAGSTTPSSTPPPAVQNGEVPASRADAPGEGRPAPKREPSSLADRMPGPGVVMATAALVVLAGATMWWWRGSATDGVPTTDVGPAPPGASPGARSTVALMPFGGAGPGSGAGSLARGLHEQLLTRLSGVSGLEVVSAFSRLPDGGRGIGPAALADSLGAGWALAGEIQRAGEQIQVSARLVDPATATVRWAHSYRREFTVDNVFEIQDEITRSIAEALEVELGATDSGADGPLPTTSSAAYELYLQARGITFQRRAGEEEAEVAARLYRRALELDSTFAEAWAGLADLYAGLSWTRDDGRARADSGVAAARRAIRHDPELAFAHVQLGDNLATLGRAGEQMDAYREALRLDPSQEQALNNMNVVLVGNGRIAEAMRWLDRARRHAPDESHLAGRIAVLNAMLGRSDAARAWMDAARRRGHELPETRFDLALYFRGDVEEAREALRKIRARHRRPFGPRMAALALYRRDWRTARRRFRALVEETGPASSWQHGLVPAGAGLAFALDRLGRDSAARSAARETVDALAERRIFFGQEGAVRVQGAVARLVLGDTARALRELRKAVDAGFLRPRESRRSPLFDPLRHRTGFRAVLSRMDSLMAEERRRVEQNGWGEPPASPPVAGRGG